MTPDTLREDVARIIDPKAWDAFAYNKRCAADREAWNTMEGIRQAPGFHKAADDAVADSLAKADAVLALPALASAGGWLPIEGAPRDGTHILAWTVHSNAKFSKDPIGEGWACPTVIQWIAHNGGGWTWYGLAGEHTHYMPLPPPPAPSWCIPGPLPEHLWR